MNCETTNKPICQHFGTCGGCTFQDLLYGTYLVQKSERLREVLSQAGIDTTLEPVRHYPVASRRRAALSAHKTGRDVHLGYNAARSHDLVDVKDCAVLLPELAATLPMLRELLAKGLTSGSKARVHLTRAANGIDCVIDAASLPHKLAAEIIGLASASKMIRLIWNGDTIFVKEAPAVVFGGVSVALPPGAFLQAVEACELDMAQFAVTALQHAGIAGRPVCDLFAGLGAFSFPWAEFSPVTAIEMDGLAVNSMQAAMRKATGIKPVTAVRRDLYRNPLGLMELNHFAAAVIDPPREGAEAQFRSLASSKMQTIVALSCNPGTFARDAAHLLRSGFKISRLAAFDQFIFSSHVEIAAVFRKK